MTPLDLTGLPRLMNCTSGRPSVTIGLIDGPVALNHSELASDCIREIPVHGKGACTRTNSLACMHGTFVAGILSAKRGSTAPAICPGCTLLIRPVFAEGAAADEQIPRSSPQVLADAIVECIASGALCINLSLGLAQPSPRADRDLEDALDHAARRGVIVVAAAGNDGTLGGTTITRHAWVVPVVACDSSGRPLAESSLGRSIGGRGLRAPGWPIAGLGAAGKSLTLGGTSVATAFVTGAVALLLSTFPGATAKQVKIAITQAYTPRPATLVPPLLDAWAAYQFMEKCQDQGANQ